MISWVCSTTAAMRSLGVSTPWSTSTAPSRLPGTTTAAASVSWRSVMRPRRSSSGPMRSSGLEEDANTSRPSWTVDAAADAGVGEGQDAGAPPLGELLHQGREVVLGQAAAALHATLRSPPGSPPVPRAPGRSGSAPARRPGRGPHNCTRRHPRGPGSTPARARGGARSRGAASANAVPCTATGTRRLPASTAARKAPFLKAPELPGRRARAFGKDQHAGAPRAARPPSAPPPPRLPCGRRAGWE